MVLASVGIPEELRGPLEPFREHGGIPVPNSRLSGRWRDRLGEGRVWNLQALAVEKMGVAAGALGIAESAGCDPRPFSSTCSPRGFPPGGMWPQSRGAVLHNVSGHGVG